MFRNILSCISQLWDLLRESMSSTSTPTSQIPPSSPLDSMPSTINSQTQPSTTIASTSSRDLSASYSTHWDVFLSFRGSDTRNKFTSHLYDKLDSNGIRTFKDDPELSRGEVISDALLDAIRKSKTYIVVISENYASSSWCLDELAEIINCYKTMQRLVIPVFYNIEPSVVCHQTGSFQQAFQKHHVRFEIEKVNKWRLTLTEVANFSGYHVSENRSEADVINEIVDELLVKINPKTLDVAKYPVGLDSHVKTITTLLSSQTKGVIKFGIYGMGGVGKTTLAKALFNQLVRGRRFKGSCFLANVWENSGTSKGLVSLQRQLINDVLRSTTKVEVHNVDQGIKLIEDRICSTKIVVVIDDIDDPKHFQSLVGPFASGSVVIITTRDEEVLDKIEVETRYRYMVNTLDDADALALFNRHAFGSAEPNGTLMELSKDIVCLAGGLPLALEVFGSHLYMRSEVGWESYIEKLQRNPDSTIHQRLVISLDALESDDPILKKLFLDIACSFIGWKKEDVVHIIESYYSYADHYIDMLKKRCLLTIDTYDRLEMHDLLRDMGREIAHNKSREEPGKHSRLWATKDIHDVLKNHKGTEAIECIIFDEEEEKFELEEVGTETFKMMRRLRFLSLINVNLTGNFKCIPDDLRWLRWKHCPLECLPSEFYPQKLVVLELPYSKMRTMWELNMVSHVFEKLKTLSMSYSKDLTTTPDFTKLPSLETLDLHGCESLEEVDIPKGSLMRLVSLNLQGCENLRSLPNTICDLRALEVLDISECNSLEALPIQLGNIISLTKLNAKGLRRRLVWDNIFSLTKLNAEGLKVFKLPDSIGHLSKLVELTLEDNKKLETLPDTICNLRSLDLSYGGITALPSGFSQLSNLHTLDINDCYNLLSIPELPLNLKSINASSCVSLERLPNLSNLKHLEFLDLSAGFGLTEIQGMEELTALRELNFTFCIGLKYIEGLDKLSSIQTLSLEGGCLAYNSSKHLFQIYSEFGRQIKIDVRNRERDQCDWITESPYWTSGSTTVYAHLLPNESHNFLGIILCFEKTSEYYGKYDCSVKNTASGFIWSDRLYQPWNSQLMVIVPKSIFSITDDDHIIEFTADNNSITIGIHLLYKTETKMIQDVFKNYVIDIDPLKLVDPVLQSIFLDIACSFIDWEKEEAVRILETFYSDVNHKIDILKNRCLLKINDWNKLEMNDLLQHIGRKTAQNNSPDEPGKHSRLWLSLDIYDVLKKQKETKAIEVIIPRKLRYQDALEGESFTTEAFKKMSNLRFLYLKNVNLTGSYEQTLEDLRWLCWDKCPLECLPSDFYPPKLVILELPHSKLRTMWEPNMVSHVFDKLKTLNMSHSLDLTRTPDFIKLPYLEMLNFESCKSLKEVHISIGRLVRLSSLNLHNCVNLEILPDTISNLRMLRYLDIGGCTSLEAMPIGLGNCESLTELKSCGLSVSKLPNSMGHLSKLVKLNLYCNMNLETLPDSICDLISLEVLDISGCKKLEVLPDQLWKLTRLRKLDAGGATKLIKLPNIESRQVALSLQRLDLSKTALTALPSGFSQLTNLEDLVLTECCRLFFIIELPTNLKRIKADGCTFMERIPNLCSLKQLQMLDLTTCTGLTEIQGFEEMASLTKLELGGCNSSFVTNTFTKRLFQMLCGFGHQIKIYIPSAEFPDWISQSSNLGSTMSLDSTISLNLAFQKEVQQWSSDLPPNESHNFLGMILCFNYPVGEFYIIKYSIKNTTSGFILSGSHYNFQGFNFHNTGSLMVIVPRSIFPVRDGDERVELTANKEIHGIYLLYKTELE